ncbi:MAG TPA: GAF domain-containing sensor histidine kinase, partial [Actinomycetota bacterium]|nr:GAF domain-containing sensor histidine kinase [Actinomycetota bacterium]
IGLLIALRKPGNRLGWLLLAGPLPLAVWFLAQEYAIYSLLASPGALPGGRIAAWLTTWIWIPALGGLGMTLLMFPDGRTRSPRWRIAVWTMALSVTFGAATAALWPGPIDNFPEVGNPFGVASFPTLRSVLEAVTNLAFAGSLVAAGASMVLRLRSARGDERVQLRWVAFAASLVPVTFVIVLVADLILGEGILADLASWIYVLVLLGLPLAIGIAILKHRLFDIEIVISKAVVFAILGTFITAVYVAVVVGVGAVIGERASPALSAVAAALVALAFQPVRRWARRVSDRLVYGDRATPYEVLSEFSQRVAGSFGIDDVAPRMATILGEGTASQRAEVWLRVGPGLRRVAAWPPGNGSPTAPLPTTGDELPAFPGANAAVAVRHRGELLGALTVRKPRSEPLTPTEERLVEDLARQAGLVLRNARLVEDLRGSRERLVRAQDEERRRLERNLHDGAQQQLVSLAVKVGMAESAVRKDPTGALTILAQVRRDAQDALEDLRDLARGIFPPVLADEGLAAALRAQARKATVPVEIRADGVGRYRQEAESATYFCCVEALQNATKYAEASLVQIDLAVTDDELRFEVRDDGHGFDPASVAPGAGLQNMFDRLEAIGGSLQIRSAPGTGTTVAGRIPLRQEVRA